MPGVDRLFPASSADLDMNEAARMRVTHQTSCRFRGIAEPPASSSTKIDDRATELAGDVARLNDVIAVETPHVPRSRYNREPSGRGWIAVITEYVQRNPAARAREVADALNCTESTANTYVGAARKAVHA